MTVFNYKRSDFHNYLGSRMNRTEALIRLASRSLKLLSLAFSVAGETLYLLLDI